MAAEQQLPQTTTQLYSVGDTKALGEKKSRRNIIKNKCQGCMEEHAGGIGRVRRKEDRNSSHELTGSVHSNSTHTQKKMNFI
jgi:hypothetical protein